MRTLLLLLLFTTYCYSPDVIPPQYKTDYSTEEAAAKPHLTIEYKGRKLGFVHGSILMFEEGKSQWDTILKTPMYISSAAVIENKLVIANSWPHQLYSVDLINKKTTPYNLPQKLFSGKKVSKLSIEFGSSGCFHGYTYNREYKLKKKSLNIYSKKGKQKYFRGMRNSVDYTLLQNIVNEADLKSKVITLEELEITDNDITEFKKMLDTVNVVYARDEYTYSFQENANLNFYRNTADSLDKISPDIINNAFKVKSEVYSTAVEWHKLTIEFEDSSKLTIENYDCIPGYYYAPWVINYNGLLYETNSIKLGKMIDELTGGKFLEDQYKDNKYAIFKITDYLYDKSLGREQ
jgi:hypothetical protein